MSSRTSLEALEKLKITTDSEAVNVTSFSICVLNLAA